MNDTFSSLFNDQRFKMSSIEGKEDKFNFIYDEVTLAVTAQKFEADKPFENRTEVASSLWHMNQNNEVDIYWDRLIKKRKELETEEVMGMVL